MAAWLSLRPAVGRRAAIRIAAVALLMSAFGLVACEYPGVPHPRAVQAGVLPVDSVPATESPADAPVDDGEAGHEPGDATRTPKVSLKDFSLDPDTLIVKAGQVIFTLTNEGRYTHDFRVEGQDIDERAPKVGRRRTSEWTVTLVPGDYQISCPISNHAARGMVGSLTVVE